MTGVNEFSTLTFDCYGTLIDWERGILGELRPWAARHGREDLDDNVLLETFGSTEAACEAETPGTLYPQILEEVLRRLGRIWDIRSTADEVANFGQSVGRWPAFAESATALQYLKRYYKLVIISNVDRASFALSNQKLDYQNAVESLLDLDLGVEKYFSYVAIKQVKRSPGYPLGMLVPDPNV